MSFVVVHKADGYYLVDGRCPQRMITAVKATPFGGAQQQPTGEAWIVARTDTTTNTALPAGGLRLGGDGDGWGTPTSAGLVLDPSGSVMITTTRNGSQGGPTATYGLSFDVGQYRDADGNLGQWNDLVAEGDCLTE